MATNCKRNYHNFVEIQKTIGKNLQLIETKSFLFRSNNKSDIHALATEKG